ncbi:MAG: lactonase family protein [Clostridia bacterium]|nr:lactonase family protein [Clostridia bacterium]
MQHNFWLGGYGEESICRMRFEAGQFELISRYPAFNASYLCFGRNNQTLYAVNETRRFLGEETGSVHSFEPQGDGTLKQTSVKATGGTDPCHVSVVGNVLLVANYTSGSLSRFMLNEDGSIGAALPLIAPEGRGVHRERQEHSHVHQALQTPNGPIAFTDLGLDAISFIQEEDLASPEPAIVPVRTPAGFGPRHCAFPLYTDAWYALCELESALLVYRGAPEKASLVGRLPLGGGDRFNAPAALRISPDGGYLAASVRGENLIALFRITESGMPVKLTETWCGGDWPRDIQFTPDGEYLLCANERGNALTAFHLENGRLKQIGEYATPAPTCILFDESW